MSAILPNWCCLLFIAVIFTQTCFWDTFVTVLEHSLWHVWVESLKNHLLVEIAMIEETDAHTLQTRLLQWKQVYPVPTFSCFLSAGKTNESRVPIIRASILGLWGLSGLIYAHTDIHYENKSTKLVYIILYQLVKM